ncbi:MAG TPA: carboxypeptidase-like regulatory domain-containing protein, partial [Pyrinomonadaceae bacterium]|nr:carboxypeptidase-like regulatory domain-containing protein [Pyrinomonadaceae bacterium]
MNSQRTAPRRRETIAAVLTFALACLAAVAPPAPARARQKEKTPEPKSVVRGRAVYADTERPVRRARVKLLNSDERGSERTGLTNERGEFEIKNVAAGSYILAVDAPGVVTPVGYIDIETRERPDLTEVSKNFEMVTVDGKAAYEVTVRARRGAALSGRVTYADGDPAPGLAVHVMRRAGAHYVKILSGLGVGAVMGARTDDRGVFRVSGLPPGEYVVGVSESAEHDDEGGRRDEEVAGFAEMFESYGRQLFTTFHPSATTAGEAAAVRVEAGEEREGLDIVVSERAARVVSGRVRGRADKRPVAGARVSIARRGDGAPAPTMTPYGDFG